MAEVTQSAGQDIFSILYDADIYGIKISGASGVGVPLIFLHCGIEISTDGKDRLVKKDT